MAGVELSHVGKVYHDGTRAVSDLNLHISDGEFLVLVGPSGCGKTTALRMIAGLEEISEGTITIGDRVVNHVPSRDRDVAMVFQSYALYPHLTIRDNIGFGLQLRKMDKKEIQRRVQEAAHILGLSDHLDRKPRNLSGGQRQRVAMGRAIVREPQVFLMDEPLSNLDAKLRVQMRAEVARLQRDLGTTTIYVTHDQTEAMTLGDRVAVMKQGVLQQVAEPQTLYDHPNNIFVAGFIGSPAMNLVMGTFGAIDAEPDTDRVPLRLGSHELLVPRKVFEERPALARYENRPVVVGIRPEDLSDATLVEPGPGEVFRASADLVEAMGSDVVVHLQGDADHVDTDDTRELARDSGRELDVDHEKTIVVARFSPRTTAAEGQTLEVRVDTERLQFFDPETGLAVWDDTENHVGGT